MELFPHSYIWTLGNILLRDRAKLLQTKLSLRFDCIEVPRSQKDHSDSPRHIGRLCRHVRDRFWGDEMISESFAGLALARGPVITHSMNHA